jgi:peptide deformylase
MIKLLDYRTDKKRLLIPGDKISDEMIDEEFLGNIEKMKEILLRDGVGLAATQVGWGVKLFLLAIDDKGDMLEEPQICLNPEILNFSKSKIKLDEGCLSLPNLFLKIKRPEFIRWRCQNLTGESIVEEVGGIRARAVQHEIDHLDGKVFINLASSVQKIKIKKWLKVF